MSEYQVIGTQQDITIGAEGVDDILQCVRIIMTTMSFSVPLDRDFAYVPGFVDQPLPAVKQRMLVAVAEAIQKHEPRVEVVSIDYVPDTAAAMDGRLLPVCVIRIKPEYWQ